jgi:hypothetical protein
MYHKRIMINSAKCLSREKLKLLYVGELGANGIIFALIQVLWLITDRNIPRSDSSDFNLFSYHR